MATRDVSSGTQPSTVTLPVHLNYAVPVEAKQEGLDECIAYIRGENFREIEVKGERDSEAVLVNFGEDIKTSEEVIKRLEELGLRPGTANELADTQQSQPRPSPKLEGCFPIAALGNTWLLSGSSLRVVCLDGDQSERRLDTRWTRNWRAFWWFLAFRKESS